MKISNSKKQLAGIIHENGGWRDGAEFSVQDGMLGYVGFHLSKPARDSVYWKSEGGLIYKFLANKCIPNWSNTILSRDEYFHLYPAPVKVVVENHTTCRLTVTDGPSIEQMAADYRNAKDCAERKQQEADAAKADAEAKLAALVAAGDALGLALRVAPAREYAGEFYNSELGERPSYGAGTREAICDGCGKRYGAHFGYNCKPGARDA